MHLRFDLFSACAVAGSAGKGQCATLMAICSTSVASRYVGVHCFVVEQGYIEVMVNRPVFEGVIICKDCPEALVIHIDC